MPFTSEGMKKDGERRLIQVKDSTITNNNKKGENRQEIHCFVI